MTQRFFILNLVLGLVVVAAAFQFREDWEEFDATRRIEDIQPDPETDLPLSIVTPPERGSSFDWTETAAHNTFSFDRSDVPIIPALPDDALVQVLGTTEPKPVFFGTILLGSDNIAMLARAGEDRRNYRPVRVGESIDGWEVVEIQRKPVVVTANGSRETLIMNDPTAGISRERSRTVSRNTTSQPVIVSNAPSSPTASTATQAPIAPGTRVIETPFGTKVIQQPR